jgi:RNA polymerase sigma-70 factor, ECF subfamily
MTLADTFLSHLPQGVSAAEDPELEAHLAAQVQKARLAHPDIQIPDALLVEHAAQFFPAELSGSVLDELERLSFPDLLVALGCGHGDRVALQFFDGVLMRHVQAALRRRGHPPDRVEELLQITRQRLLVRENDRDLPRILDYAGRGPIEAWVRTAAIRLAINYAQQEPYGERELEPDMFVSEERDPEVRMLKERYRDDFNLSFKEALTDLDRKERAVLRLAAVEQMSSDAIATLYNVHRSSANRWIALARDKLLAATRDRMIARAQVDPSEIDSLLRILRSELEVSLRTALAESQG